MQIKSQKISVHRIHVLIHDTVGECSYWLAGVSAIIKNKTAVIKNKTAIIKNKTAIIKNKNEQNAR